MAEPRIFFYDPTNAAQMHQQQGLTFTAVGGGAIKAGDDSAIIDVAIWNNPYGPGIAPVDQPKDSSNNLLAWGVGGVGGDGITAATDVDITCRDVTGLPTGDVTLGKWLNVTFVTAGGTDNLYGNTYLAIGVNPDTSSVAAHIGIINPNNYFAVKFKLHPAGNAQAGPKTFTIRISYSFT
jgi:hypothetical protein